MKERPILFSGPMVRAILDGRKTQTRRVVKRAMHPVTNEVAGSVNKDGSGLGWIAWFPGPMTDEQTVRCYPGEDGFKCQYGQPGDRLWVREKWSGEHWLSSVKPSERMLMGNPSMIVSLIPETWYWADGNPYNGDWEKPRPSIHMPRWASRITLEIVSVRIERLQEIIEADAIAEGLKAITKDGQLIKYGIPDRDGLPGSDDYGWHWHEWKVDPREAYRKLWESINGPGSWAANPFVWVIEFKRVMR